MQVVIESRTDGSCPTPRYVEVDGYSFSYTDRLTAAKVYNSPELATQAIEKRNSNEAGNRTDLTFSLVPVKVVAPVAASIARLT